jgi:hypothetical protein
MVTLGFGLSDYGKIRPVVTKQPDSPPILLFLISTGRAKSGGDNAPSATCHGNRLYHRSTRSLSIRLLPAHDQLGPLPHLSVHHGKLAELLAETRGVVSPDPKNEETGLR